jgi:hypothetical protein
MAEKVLTIRLRVQDDGSVVLERGAKAVDKLAASEANAAAEARRATDALKHQTDAVKSIDDKVTSATHAVKAFFAAWIVKEAIGVVEDLVKRGIEFNAEMQKSKLTVAGLLTGFGEIRDSHGQILKGQERWNAALVISGDLQKRVAAEAKRTGIAITDILDVLQVSMASALQTGVTDINKVIDLATRLSQAGQAFGFNGQRLMQEARSLMSGQKNSELANAILGDVSAQKFDDLKQSGKLVDFLIERFSSFDKAATESANTVGGALSRLKNQFDQSLGAATADATDSLTQSIKDLTKEVNNPDFIAGVKAIADTFASVASELGKATAAFLAAKGVAGSGQAAPNNWLQNVMDWIYGADAGTFGPNAQYGSKIYGKPYTDWRNANFGVPPSSESKRQYPWPIGPSPTGYSASGKHQPIELDKEDIEQLRKTQIEYLRSLHDFRARLAAMGDPLAESLVAIHAERQKKIDDLDLQAKKLAEKHGINTEKPNWFSLLPEKARQSYSADRANAETEAKEKELAATMHQGAVDAARAWEGAFAKRNSVAKLSLETDRQIENERLALLKEYVVTTKQAIDAELQERLTANARETEDTRQKAEESRQAYEATALMFGAGAATKDQLDAAKRRYDEDLALYGAYIKAREQKDQQAEDNAERLRRRDTVGTKEWAEKVRQTVQQRIGDLPGLVTEAVISSRLAATGEIEKFLDDVIDGNANALRSLEDLGKNVGKTWAHVIAGVLTNSQGARDQLKELWKDLGAQGTGDRMMAGAGIGAFVGGFGPKGSQSQNTAMLGGSIGGFFGPIGAVVGAVLGAALGSLIQKGKDWIKVAIATSVKGDLIVGVTEKGISAEARHDLEIQVRRRVKETMKSWQEILDLLPEQMKAELAKLPAPRLDIHGGVEAGDIRDETALNSLQDFLANKMPKEVFAAYRGSIEKALQLLGADAERIKTLFEYWGTLQGSELHDAVQRFFQAVIVANDFRGKFDKLATGGDAFYHPLREAAMGRSPLQQIQDLNAQMAMIAASMTKMTDIEDLTAAQARLNALSEQRYNMSIAAEQEIINLRKQQIEQNSSLAEQIKLAGMGDQEKLNYFYSQINNLRDALTRTTDPKQIAEIEGKLRQYIQAAFGVAPGNEENRNKLLGILQWMTDIGEGRFNLAENDISKEDQKAASMLQQAAEALLRAAQALGGGNGKPKPEPGPGEPKEPPDKKDYTDVTIGLKSFGEQITTVTDDLRHLADWANPANLADVGRTIAAAVEDGLAKATITLVANIPIDARGLIDASVQKVRVELIRNRDSFSSRTS